MSYIISLAVFLVAVIVINRLTRKVKFGTVNNAALIQALGRQARKEQSKM